MSESRSVRPTNLFSLHMTVRTLAALSRRQGMNGLTFLQFRLQKFKKGKPVGKDKTPHDVYAALGEAGILQLADLIV